MDGRIQIEPHVPGVPNVPHEIAGSAPDEVSNPRHYMGHAGIACMDALESMMGPEAVRDYWWGCAFKYLWRWKEKNGLQDLMKCRQCVDYLVESLRKGAE